jgi:DNA-binding ferritin-like protein (Dps family)
MATTNSDDTKRVSTYVPTEQKREWKDHAERLDMTQSEFVRTMVQAGRRDFTISREETQTSDATPGGDGLKDAVLDTLRTADHLDWDELVAELTDTVEDDIERVLDELQDDNRVRYSGRDGGYSLTDSDR